jgi:transposase, IS30 family
VECPSLNFPALTGALIGQNYSQLNIGERNQFYALRKAKLSMTEIANQLSRPRATLYRELGRNSGGRGYRVKGGVKS